MPMQNLFYTRSAYCFTHFATADSVFFGIITQVIPCTLLTDNDECIRVYYGERRTVVLLQI